MAPAPASGYPAEFVASLPKTETHLHIEGALPWRLLHRLDPRQFPHPPKSWDPDFRFRSFAHFEEELFAVALPWFTSPERYYEAASEVFQDLAAQGVRYVETSFASGVLEFLDVPGPETAEAIHRAAPPGMEVRVFMGIHHNGYTEKSRRFVEDCVNWDQLDGIDLHGDETIPLEDWSPRVYEQVRAAGKFVKAHAGELCGPDFVRRIIAELGVTRIEHGVRSVEDPELLRELQENGIVLDVCPTSNVKLGVAPSIAEHPLRRLHDAGVRCTVNTDDPISFGNTLTGEYIALATEGGFSRAELIQLARNGFEIAMVPEKQRAAWLTLFEEVR